MVTFCDGSMGIWKDDVVHIFKIWSLNTQQSDIPYRLCYVFYIFTNFFFMWFVMNRKLNSSFCTYMSLHKRTYTINCGHVSRLLQVLLLPGISKLCAWFYISPLQYSFIDLLKLVRRLSTKQPNFTSYGNKKNIVFE